MAKTEKPVLFIAKVAAETPDGTILPGSIAEAGSAVLRKYAEIFEPLTITYKA